MFEKIKKFKKLNKEIKELSLKQKEERGNVLEICVADDSAFLSPYSPDGAPLIGGETIDFIEHNVKNLALNEQIEVVIKSNCISESEKPVYENAIKNYYRAEFSEAVKGLRRNTVFTVCMTVIAALIFAFAIVLDKFGVDSVILNMIDVVAWVFMWEAADVFVFRRGELKLSRLKSYGLARAKIVFKDL